MDKEKIIEKDLEQVSGGMSETDSPCCDAVTDKPKIKCKFKGKVRVCPYPILYRIRVDCGDCRAEKTDGK